MGFFVVVFKPGDSSRTWNALLNIWKLVISLGPSIAIRENNSILLVFYFISDFSKWIWKLKANKGIPLTNYIYFSSSGAVSLYSLSGISNLKNIG